MNDTRFLMRSLLCWVSFTRRQQVMFTMCCQDNTLSWQHTTQSPVDYMRHHQFFLVVDSLLSFPAINYILFFQDSIIMTDVEELISHDLFC